MKLYSMYNVKSRVHYETSNFQYSAVIWQQFLYFFRVKKRALGSHLSFFHFVWLNPEYDTRTRIFLNTHGVSLEIYSKPP